MIRALTLALLFCPLLANAADPSTTARQRMQSFSNNLQSVSADFKQVVTTANGKATDETAGSLALSAPNRFRWEAKTPFEQLIVADGAKVWIYDPDLEQVSVRNQSSEEAHSPLSVLTDLARMDREFTTSEAGDRDSLQWLKLVSKAKEPDFEYAELGFDARDLARMHFKDQLGNDTEIRFSNWKRNPSLPASTFAFKPPAGVDVIGDVKPDADVFPLNN